MRTKCALQNLPAVAAACGWLLGILAPFLLGAAIAFILNVPMRAIERHLYPQAKRGAALRRPLALVLTLVAVIGVLALAGGVIGGADGPTEIFITGEPALPWRLLLALGGCIVLTVLGLVLSHRQD